MLSAVDRSFSLILFGASGHLARIKIFPALYFLALKKRLPEQYTIMGYSRTPMTDTAFRAFVADAIREHVLEVNAGVLESLLAHVHYTAGQYDKTEDFEVLNTKLDQLEGGSESVRLAYLSIPPTVFRATVENLCKGGIHRKGKPFRCIMEKPLGHDRATCDEILKTLSSCFTSEETYILDHYLGKEAVRNVYYLRHANPVIERLLSRSMISHVQIVASESAGLEGRAGYFDAVGTLRDMFQSHLLQITALLTMPLVHDGRTLSLMRRAALAELMVPDLPLSDVIIQGQYDGGLMNGTSVPAYRDEDGVSKGSRTCTYAALKIETALEKFHGVPFYLRSGKRMKNKETRISIEFQSSVVMPKDPMNQNRLDIILQGEAGMKFYLQTKLGGSEPKFRPLIMEDPLVCMGDCLVEHSLLLLEAIHGLQDWFLTPEEVERCWDLIDPLQAYLDRPETPLSLYAPGSQGPAEADAFIQRDGHRWF